MAEVTANGVRLHVQRLGAGGGPPVVFVHGLVMDNLSSWYFTAGNKMAASADVILYDLRGHGRSERPASGYDVDTLVADLAGLLDALGVTEPIALVGNSFGGLLAVAFALRHPRRVAKIALVDAHIQADGWSEAMTATLGLEGAERDAKIAESFKSWLGRHSPRKRNRLAEAARQLVHETTLVEDLRRSPALGEAELAAIGCPVLAIYGEQSDVRTYGERLARTLPDCELRLLAGGTHSILWEATAEVCRQLAEWVTGASGGKSAGPLRAPAGEAVRSRPGRFLFVVPPLAGHVNPTVAVAAELERRGHTCAWMGHPPVLRRLLPPGATVFGFEADRADDAATQAEHARDLRGAAALKFLFEDFLVPLARAMLPGALAAIDAFAPDVVVADQQALAGGLAARLRGLPWASFCTTSASLVDPFAGLPRVREWLDRLLAGLEAECGLAASSAGELSTRLVVAFSTPALVGERAFPPHYRWVGPSIGQRPEAVPFPWEALAKRRRVLVSLGTVNAEGGGRFYREVLEAVAGLPLQAILVAPDGLVGDAPENVLVRSWVPQLALLPHLDAVVCHAGHNTVVEALAHGLPLVVAPIKDDQPVVADQVVRTGAGLRVRYGRVRAPELREVIARVLEEPGFRAAAAVIRESFAEAGGAPRAAACLEELL